MTPSTTGDKGESRLKGCDSTVLLCRDVKGGGGTLFPHLLRIHDGKEERTFLTRISLL